ncbi:VENN motif pre-toxin domain-containing protein, partial [Serratia microhaemolytica]|uniref:cytidine deaminase-like fold-containing protein n=2 Tax=Serratia microhaemolytica TaxID=2675110 RepID=UPI001F0C9AA2
AAGASAELMANAIMNSLYPGKKVSELTEEEKQNIASLSTLAAGLAGGLLGDSSSDTAKSAQIGKNAVENNYLSVSEKTELELAKQALQKATDPAEKEKAQEKINALIEKDISSNQKVLDACSNGGAASAACAQARLEVIAAKEGYENLGNYNSKASQQYADAYGQIVDLLNITSVDAQNQQQVKDALINFFMTTKGVDYATAKGYAELKQGSDIIVASLTPVLGAAAAKAINKIAGENVKINEANLKVKAEGNVDGNKFIDTNQGARPSQLADFNKPTLINDVVQAKIVKEPHKNFPNGNMGTAHAEIGVIQQAYEKGMTNGRDMLMSVSGEPLCTYCLSDVKAMAAKSGLKSLTIYEEFSGDVLYWEAGTKKFIRK